MSHSRSNNFVEEDVNQSRREQDTSTLSLRERAGVRGRRAVYRQSTLLF